MIPRPRFFHNLAGRFGLLLLLLLALQAGLTGVAVFSWIRARDLALHKVELGEQAGLILPALADSLSRWSGSGPALTRQSSLRHQMRRSLGRPQAMSLVWVDQAGNMAAVGFLELDPRLPELKRMIQAGHSERELESSAGRLNLALVVRATPAGWLILAGDSATRLWTAGSRGLLVALLAGSAGSAGLAGWWLARPLLRRFRALSRAFSTLGEGGFSHRLADPHPDELGQLAREFDQMAAQVERLTADLARSDRERRQLLSEVSHELGAPLTNLIGYLDLLQREDSLAPEPRATLRLCSSQAKRLDHLVSDLLDLARLDDAGLRLRHVELDLRDTVDQEVAAIELACLDRGIQLDWQRPAEAAPILGDEARLAQILRNLLRNSVHQLANPLVEGPTLRVMLETSGGRIELRVLDNGPGIRPADLAQLFDRYHRPHSSWGEGSGLGLCISRRLAELHGGTLEGASAGLGRGAVFTLSLPRAPTPPAT